MFYIKWTISDYMKKSNTQTNFLQQHNTFKKLKLTYHLRVTNKQCRGTLSIG